MTGPPLQHDTHYMDMAHESTGRLRTVDDARAAHQHSVGGRANALEAASLGGWRREETRSHFNVSMNRPTALRNPARWCARP